MAKRKTAKKRAAAKKTAAKGFACADEIRFGLLAKDMRLFLVRLNLRLERTDPDKRENLIKKINGVDEIARTSEQLVALGFRP